MTCEGELCVRWSTSDPHMTVSEMSLCRKYFSNCVVLFFCEILKQIKQKMNEEYEHEDD